jgi:cytochrome c
VGPNLWGVVGRQSGSARGYQYSPALAKLNVIWTADTLNDFLAMPATYAPGTQMAFDGLPKKLDRDAVICFLSLTN